MHRELLAYFLTFRTYGSRLPGDTRGSTHRRTGRDGLKQARPSESLHESARSLQAMDSVVFSSKDRRCVHRSLVQTCECANWPLHALNVRSNHVHIVVTGDRRPECMMSSLKAWATRALRENGLVDADQRVWARHGSTIYLFSDAELAHACWYTSEAQDGERFELPCE